MHTSLAKKVIDFCKLSLTHPKSRDLLLSVIMHTVKFPIQNVLFSFQYTLLKILNEIYSWSFLK
jgi:hypothetical protein